MRWKSIGLASAGLLVAAVPLSGQAPGGWDAPRALELMERARARRALPAADSGLSSYQASANGYIYFYLDREGGDARTLVKVNQIALEVYWAAPNRTKQRIVGMREEMALPSRIHYHLDHLTVVQNEFGDRIRMGEGDEVRDVPHPAAPGSDSIYAFRVADSLTLRLPGAPEPIRVYEIEVKPRRMDRPALIGSVFLDRRTAAIVRMAFTFTPVSYIDPRLDYIRVSLDNGLWEGRYWLPNEQRIEIRRQVPILDFPVGGVIRGVLHIGDYRLNRGLPAAFFRGPRVVAVPRELRERYDFEAGLYAGLDEEGLDPPVDLATLRRRAAELVGVRDLSGLPRLRLYVPNASSALRYDRAEGVYIGAGASYALGAGPGIEVSGGYAFGAHHLALAGALRLPAIHATAVTLRAGRNMLRDLGIRPGAAGALNSLSAAMAGDDYLDPYYASGAALEFERRLGARWRAGLRLGYHEHRSAALEERTALFDGDARFRPVRAVGEGALYSVRAVLRRDLATDLAAGWSGDVSLEVGAHDGEEYIRPVVTMAARDASADRRTTFDIRATGGFISGHAPAQRLFLLGGRGTLPGFAYRGFIGDRFILADAEASREIFGPWVRLRALGAIGWTDMGTHTAPADWGVASTDGVRASLGFGLGLIYDVLRIDFARGLDGGDWQTIISVSPRLRDML
ncbi:MAG TPA: hypothetical protein VF188_13745 [Longimicrobiales bacterium]